jgi:RNA polymerase sigma-70 factor (ECF subfamily)
MHVEPTTGGAIEPLITQFEGPLLRYAASVTGDLERARDVVQETFFALHREMTDGARGPVNGQIAAWLFTVCRHRALDVLRKEQRMTTLASETTEAAVAPEPSATELEQRELAGQLRQSLAQLPERQQELVRLKFQNNLSYREIAEVTGLSVSNVGFLLHTAIKRLRAGLVERERAP